MRISFRPQKTVFTWVLPVVILTVAFAAHAYGMFAYPYYENDEGIYMSQAHSLLTEGKLSPYTYWYDHAPFGWITIAGWAGATGGFFTFGPSVNTGRVLMLLAHLAATGMVYFLGRRIGRSSVTGAVAALLFALSPLSLYYGRRVLLDNMMIVWALLGLSLLSVYRPRLPHVLGAGVAFALALLTKESAIVLLPAILYLVYSRRKEIPFRWPSLRFLLVTGLVGTLYPLYAFVRGELFEGEGTTSLIGTLRWQMDRGNGLPFWNMESDFFLALSDWFFRDPFLVSAGLFGAVVVIGWSLWEKRLRMLALALFFTLIFLMRGGLVFNFYVLALLPFLALTLAVIATELGHYIGNGRRIVTAIAMTLLVAGSLLPSILYSFDQYLKNETAPQVEAVRWVKANLPEDAVIAIDDYAYADYHDSTFGGTSFPGAEAFWKIETDPSVRDAKLGGDWRNIDYLVVSDMFRTQIDRGMTPLSKSAYLSSTPVHEWKSDETEYAFRVEARAVDPELPIEIVYQVDPEVADQLFRSFRTYKKFFFRDYGQIIDPDTGVTTSEGQSYAMLRAVWLGDREAFDGAWDWTQDHLQFRTDDALISWKWVLDKLEDSTNATDADEDIALALIFAAKRWNEPAYMESAVEIVSDLGDHAVVEIDGLSYFLPAHWESVEQWNGYLFNPSYLSPATYRIFADIDPDHDWDKVARDSYVILDRIAEMDGHETPLPSDWLLVDKETGALSSAGEYFDYDVDRFSYDAFRTLFRVSLDYQWFGTSAAKRYLDQINTFLVPRYEAEGALPTAFSPAGEIVLGYQTTAIDAGYLASFMLNRDPDIAERFYEERFGSRYDEDGSYWGDDKYSYYDANWAWFATAMHAGVLVNLADEDPAL